MIYDLNIIQAKQENGEKLNYIEDAILDWIWQFEEGDDETKLEDYEGVSDYHSELIIFRLRHERDHYKKQSEKWRRESQNHRDKYHNFVLLCREIFRGK